MSEFVLVAVRPGCGNTTVQVKRYWKEGARVRITRDPHNVVRNAVCLLSPLGVRVYQMIGPNLSAWEKQPLHPDNFEIIEVAPIGDK